MKLNRYTILIATGILTGGAAGYLYWHYAGCTHGTCAITSRPLNSTLYGSLMGGLFFSMFHNKATKH